MSAPRPLVLVADDDPDIVTLVRLRLDRLGCEVVTAAAGDEALRLARSRPPDLAVLDVSMPGLTGLAVCDALRREPATRGVRVLLLSARAQEADRERGLAAGADGYMTKPFSPRALAERVQVLLSPA